MNLGQFILFGALNLVRRTQLKIPHDPSEIIALVDKDDKVIGSATRREVHTKGLLHRETCVYILGTKKGLYLQKRADNGFWDHPVGGHFPKEQDYGEAAVREIYEELGLKVKENELEELGKENISNKEKTNNRFVKVFMLKKDIDQNELRLDAGEVAEVRLFSKRELEKLINEEKGITGSAKKLIKKYFLEKMIE